jgi:hypothetical protein
MELRNLVSAKDLSIFTSVKGSSLAGSRLLGTSRKESSSNKDRGSQFIPQTIECDALAVDREKISKLSQSALTQLAIRLFLFTTNSIVRFA